MEIENKDLWAHYTEMQRIGAESKLIIKSAAASELYHECFELHKNKVTRNPNLHPKLPYVSYPFEDSPNNLAGTRFDRNE